MFNRMLYVKGPFNNYIDREGWVGGNSNVYVHIINDLFSLALLVYEG